MNVKPCSNSPFKPFPQLWNAFESSEPELLTKKSFGCLDDACKALMTSGKDAARAILKSNSEKL
jgi:hypothetical protein